MSTGPPSVRSCLKADMDIEHPPVPPPSILPLAAAMDLRNNTVGSVLLAVAELAVERTAGDAASVTLMNGTRPATFASTGDLASDLDETQYAQGYGPCLDAVLSNDVMTIVDARIETRWPQFTPVAIERGVLSSVSMPIPVLDSVAASINVYAAAADAFDDADCRALHEVVGHAGAAIANVHLYEAGKTLVEQLRTASLTRAVIDQARGILMAQHHCTAEEAFDILRRTSQHANRKIRDIATEIVEQVSSDRAP